MCFLQVFSFFNRHSLLYIPNCHSLLYYLYCRLSISSSLLSFSFSRFIHRELVHKGAVWPAFAPAYFDTYFDLDDKDFMFTKLQGERFPLPHLKAGAWYLDCVGGFVPSIENDLHRFLAESAPLSVVEDKVEPSSIVEVEKEKTEKAKKKRRARAMLQQQRPLLLLMSPLARQQRLWLRRLLLLT